MPHHLSKAGTSLPVSPVDHFEEGTRRTLLQGICCENMRFCICSKIKPVASAHAGTQKCKSSSSVLSTACTTLQHHPEKQKTSANRPGISFHSFARGLGKMTLSCVHSTHTLPFLSFMTPLVLAIVFPTDMTSASTLTFIPSVTGRR